MDSTPGQRTGELVTVVRRGFTLVELAVTIAVIMLIAGFALVGIPLAQRAAKRTRSASIVQTVRMGLGLSAASTGSMPAPAPHPLAASLPPRSVFARGLTTGPLVAGAAVATTGEGLVVENPAWVVGSQEQVLLDTDRYQGGAVSTSCACPGLYGLRRDEMSVLGSSAGLVRFRRLPRPRAEEVTLPSPYDATRYPDARFLVRTPGTVADLEVASRSAITVALSLGGSLAELEALRGLVTTDSGALVANDRLRVTGPVVALWKPGHVAVAGGWSPYRLRGLAIVDAWGREVLYHVAANGAATVESAGADGCFRISPGNNGVIDTPAGSAPVGDDGDGSRDNLRSGN